MVWTSPGAPQISNLNQASISCRPPWLTSPRSMSTSTPPSTPSPGKWNASESSTRAGSPSRVLGFRVLWAAHVTPILVLGAMHCRSHTQLCQKGCLQCCPSAPRRLLPVQGRVLRRWRLHVGLHGDSEPHLAASAPPLPQPGAGRLQPGAAHGGHLPRCQHPDTGNRSPLARGGYLLGCCCQYSLHTAGITT